MSLVTILLRFVLFSNVFGILSFAVSLRTNSEIFEDSQLDTVSLIRKYGYPCEAHNVFTEDGYVLEMHRITHGKDQDPGRRPVVFLMHGLLSSSAEWVLMGPGKGLAYILADEGYDVWMGNARGNTYSKAHVYLKPASTKFWQFSWHEIGYYDLPAMVDYTLKTAEVEKLQYIGFSQGTTVFWVMTSTRPEYNDKIIAMHALAPIAFVGNIKSPLIRALAPFSNTLERIFKIMGTHEFLPNGEVNQLAAQKLCTEESIVQTACANFLFLITGFNMDQLDRQTLPIVFGHTPAGASTRQIIHFAQLYKSGKFTNFNHGLIKNLRRYGSIKPPKYNLKSIRVPIFLHYSENDWLSTPNDVYQLSKEVSTVIGSFKIGLPKFNHLDFVFAINATELVYDRMVNIMSYFKHVSRIASQEYNYKYKQNKTFYAHNKYVVNSLIH